MRATTTSKPLAAAGFSLIELMIAVAIVGILVAAAVASYDFATVKTRRAAAKGCLTEGAQYMERWYTTHFSYAGAALPACSADVTDFYTVAFATGEPTASTYRVEAVPQGSQATSDTKCGTLSVNQTGVKTATDVGACW